MARQVQVALHHQVAIGRGADDLQPGAQVESFRVGGIVQSSQLAVEQGAIGQRRLHEQFALLVLAIQVGLGDLLVRPAVARRQSGDRRVVVALHGTEGDGAGTKDLQRRTGVDGDIARRRPAQTRRVQVEGAAGDAVVLPGRASRCRLGAVAQVDTGTGAEAEQPVSGVQLDQRAVRRIDDLAVAVHPQPPPMGIEQRLATDAQALLGGQADTADLLAAGVKHAVHAQMATIQRHLDRRGPDVVADVQVALLDLETARTEHLTGIQALVESGEPAVWRTVLAQPLGTDLDAARGVWHQGAASVVFAAARRQDLPL